MLPYAGEYAVATVRLSNVIDKFLDDNGLAYTGATKGANLPTLHEGTDQVDNLQACLEDFNVRSLLFEVGGRSMNSRAWSIVHFWFIIHALTHAVEATP